jgi:hypothetical protein
MLKYISDLSVARLYFEKDLHCRPIESSGFIFTCPKLQTM